MWHGMPEISPEEPVGVSLSPTLDGVADLDTVAERTRSGTDDVESEHSDSRPPAGRVAERI